MKVLIAAIGHFGDAPSGSSKIALDQAVELCRRGREVWILAPGAASLPAYESKHGIHLLRYAAAKVAPWNPSRRSAHQRAAADLLAHYLPRVDVIHGHVPLSCLAAMDFYGNSVPACYTLHSPAKMEMAIVWRHSTFLRRMMAPAALTVLHRMEAECLRRARVVTALSRYSIECIRKMHGKELAGTVQLTPGWVDTARFLPLADRQAAKARLGWPTDTPILFTLRRLVPRMGLDRLILAIHSLVCEGRRLHLLLGGSGPLRARLEKQAAMLGLESTVRLMGGVEEQMLPLAYAACDAFVLPTAQLECFGLIALEALSAGRPVLATPVGAIPEIIREFDSAWLSRSAEAADIAHLLRLFLDGKLPEHPPARLHDQVHRDYGRERRLNEFLEVTVGRVARG